jgi:polyhydroxyalkanoate synthase
MAPDADSWMKEAEFNEGSWWPRWEDWLKKRSGAQVPARIPGESDYEILTAAPGTYVLVRTND